MNIEAIPKVFWYSAALSLFAFTMGFLYISFKYGEVTIKINDLEIRTSNVLALEATLEQQEETISAREREINDLNVLLDKRAQELKTLQEELASLQPEESEELIPRLNAVIEAPDFYSEIEARQENLSSLKSTQQVQQKAFDNQRNLIQQQQQQLRITQ